jgi:hypothetical protein
MATDTQQQPVKIEVPEDALTDSAARRARMARRAGIGCLMAIIGLALTGVLGQRTSAVSVAGSGYRLRVTYPLVLRSGVDVRFEIRVVNPSGFGNSLTIAMRRHYFDMLNFNDVRPEPDSVTSTGDKVIYTWDSPPGDTFQISIDAYTEFGEHFGLDGFTSILVKDRPVLTAHYHTRWVP